MKCFHGERWARVDQFCPWKISSSGRSWAHRSILSKMKRSESLTSTRRFSQAETRKIVSNNVKEKVEARHEFVSFRNFDRRNVRRVFPSNLETKITEKNQNFYDFRRQFDLFNVLSRRSRLVETDRKSNRSRQQKFHFDARRNSAVSFKRRVVKFSRAQFLQVKIDLRLESFLTKQNPPNFSFQQTERREKLTYRICLCAPFGSVEAFFFDVFTTNCFYSRWSSQIVCFFDGSHRLSRPDLRPGQLLHLLRVRFVHWFHQAEISVREIFSWARIISQFDFHSDENRRLIQSVFEEEFNLVARRTTEICFSKTVETWTKRRRAFLTTFLLNRLGWNTFTSMLVVTTARRSNILFVSTRKVRCIESWRSNRTQKITKFAWRIYRKKNIPAWKSKFFVKLFGFETKKFCSRRDGNRKVGFSERKRIRRWTNLKRIEVEQSSRWNVRLVEVRPKLGGNFLSVF